MADMELRLQLRDLRLDLFLPRLAPLLVQTVARFLLRSLQSGDLGLHVVDVPAGDRATQPLDGCVHDLGTLLAHLGHERGVADSHRVRQLAEDRLAVIDVIHVEQGADQDARRSTDQDAQWAAQDPDDEADYAPGRRTGVADVSDLVLDVDTAV